MGSIKVFSEGEAVKHKLSILFPILLLYCLSGTVPIQAATYTVKSGGGGNYATIASCVSAMSASGGDTCTVYAGTYSENPSLKAGTTGNYNTLTVNSGDTVNINGSVTINSHTKLIGFTITRTSSPNSACVAITGNATDWYISNNVMEYCGGIQEPSNYSSTSYGYIQGNTLSYMCSTPSKPNTCEGMRINGSHHLIENNDISHVSDGVTNNAGSYNVYRNNTMHDTLDTECGSNSGNCHIDFIASEPYTIGGEQLAAAFNMYEGNYVANNIGGNAHVFLAQGDSCTGCTNLIIRFNHAYNIGTYWLLNDLGTFNHVKDYNNTFSTAQTPPEDLLSFLQTNTYGAAKNDLWYNGSPNHTEWYDVDATTGFSDGHNLAYNTSCAPTCTFSTINGFGMGHAGVENITNQDPKFVNATSDWHLQAGSPAIGAGGPLTTASGSGSGSKTLVVADADYFQDGMGLTAVGVQPDWIRIGSSTTVQISSVNYSSKTITLANSASWNSGDPVYLYKNSSGNTMLTGSNPDIGAFPYQNSGANLPAAPTNLAAFVQ